MVGTRKSSTSWNSTSWLTRTTVELGEALGAWLSVGVLLRAELGKYDLLGASLGVALGAELGDDEGFLQKNREMATN
jgi:hypothetical protein